jgi:PKD repeat protein
VIKPLRNIARLLVSALPAFSASAVLMLVTVCAQAKDAGNATDVINPHSPRYAHPYRHGVVATRETHAQMRLWADQNRPVHPSVSANKLHGAAATAAAVAAATGSKTLSFQGGVRGIGVMSGPPKVYLVFWGNQWGNAATDASGYLTLSGDPKGAAPYMQKWIKGLGTNGELWSGVMTQYCDGPLVARGDTSCPAGAPRVGYPTGGALAGVWYDNSVASPANATGNQIAAEAVKAAAHFGNTSPASNRYAQYIIMSPTGTHPDGFNTRRGGFCAWHDFNGDTSLSGGASPSSYGDIAFTNMPYVTDMGASCGANSVSSELDGFSLVGGHEYAETITDPIPGSGWINRTGSSSTGMENADECSWGSSGQSNSALVKLATGSFALQSTWSNDTNRCEMAHPIMTSTGGQPAADFTVSSNGLITVFTDLSSDPGGTIGSRNWTFGDGTTSSLASPTHTYPASGTYTVTQTVQDSLNGTTSTKTQAVTVISTGGTPVANFTATTSGLTVTFTDTSTDPGGSISSRVWSFGDGGRDTAANPVHTYTNPGTYSISETVTDSINGRTSTKVAALAVFADTQLLSNGNFDASAVAPWKSTYGVICSNATCPGETSNSGNGFAWLGGYGSRHVDVLQQSISIPAGKKSATLAFALHIDTRETVKSADDTLKVQVLSSTGVQMETLATYSNVDAAPGYTIRKFDLSPYIGKAIVLSFTGTEDAALATSFVLDDFSVTVQ